MLSKTTKNLFQCSTMVSRILIDMLEPYPDIAAFKRIAYNGLLLFFFFLRMSELPWENLLLPSL